MLSFRYSRAIAKQPLSPRHMETKTDYGRYRLVCHGFHLTLPSNFATSLFFPPQEFPARLVTVPSEHLIP